MKVLIRKARICNTHSAHHGQIRDILIENGIIAGIADEIDESNCTTVEYPGLHVSAGWMDIFAHFADPGDEASETIETGTAAAAAGGFTHVMLIPNTHPSTSSKAQVEYIVKKSANSAVTLLPIGSITQNTDGAQLSEMYDMANSGAVAFSDGIRPLQNAGLMLKALQYVVANDKIIIQIPADKSIGGHGLMNEGIMSTRLGLPGIPALAEELMIARDIELLRYTNSTLHFTGVSTKKGIELIQKAKTEGLNLSFSVTPYHAIFCDEDLEDYDTHLKTNPPLRTRVDMLAVRNAILNGEADGIASHHLPHHADNKLCEFEYAKNGMIGLQTVFSTLIEIGLTADKIAELLSAAPRKLFKMPIMGIQEQQAACLTFFVPGEAYVLEKEMIVSKSKNSPFIGKKLKGKIVGIFNNGKLLLHD